MVSYSTDFFSSSNSIRGRNSQQTEGVVGESNEGEGGRVEVEFHQNQPDDNNIPAILDSNNSSYFPRSSSYYRYQQNKRKIIPAMLSVLVILSLILMQKSSMASAVGYARLCPLENVPFTKLEFDTTSNTYVIPQSSDLVYTSEGDSSHHTMTSTNETTAVGQAISNLQEDSEETSSRDQDQNQYILAQECPCASNHYCFEGDGDTCGIPRESGKNVGCFYMSSKTVFVRNAWPVVVLWYGALFIFLCSTTNGRQVRQFFLNSCFKSQNYLLADQILFRERQLRHQMRVAALTQQHRIVELARLRRGEDGEESENTRELLLKTKIYKSPNKRSSSSFLSANASAAVETPSPQKKKKDLQCGDDRELGLGLGSTPETIQNTPHNSNSASATSSRVEGENDSLFDNGDEDEVLCTICLGSIDDGDKIGVLSCNHLFHSACLKEWIKRKNSCPLCQEPDIAAPRPQQTRSHHVQNNHIQRSRQVSSSSSSDNSIQALPQRQQVQVQAQTQSPIASSSSPVRVTLSSWRHTRDVIQNISTSADLFIPGSPIAPPAPRALIENQQNNIMTASHLRNNINTDVSRGREYTNGHFVNAETRRMLQTLGISERFGTPTRTTSRRRLVMGSPNTNNSDRQQQQQQE